jgi:hypothetical protein
LLPAESLVLSRALDSLTLSELAPDTGDEQTYRAIYALSLSGLIQRNNWPIALSGGRDMIATDPLAPGSVYAAAVDDLCPGPWGGVVSYLPGRQVAGVRVTDDHVVISVRGRWGVPVSELAGQVRAAVTELVAPRRVDVVVADLAESDAKAPAGVHGEEVTSWRTASTGGVSGAGSSAPITPTAAVTPPPSPLA